MDVRTFKIYRRFINFGHSLHWIPYKYKNMENTLSFSESVRFRVVLGISTVMLLSYEVYLLNGTVRICLDPRVQLGLKLKSVFFKALYILLNVNQWLVIAQYGEQHKYINAFFQVTQRIHCKSWK